MGIQELIVILVVALSVVYLGWHYWRRHKRKSGCASCKLMQAAQHPPVRDNTQTIDKLQ